MSAEDVALIKAVDAALRQIIRPPDQIPLWERDSFGLIEENE